MKIHNLISGESLLGKAVILKRDTFVDYRPRHLRMYKVTNDTHQTHVIAKHLIINCAQLSHLNVTIHRSNIEGWVTNDDASKAMMWGILKND